ncbi:benzoate transporter [Thermosinus carboxydivorans Nor1]|uniref:Benzoate transporter n=3 Tax=Bacteria TaxID=2 RepID=A1HNW5_9FIRM|nr:benzoate transporter [Thermosinus carboxydivorans Nor1]
MIMEKGYSLRESLQILWANISAAGVGTGLVATLFSTLGPGVIVMNAAKQGGLTDAQAVSWLFGIYVFGGLSTMFMSLRYRIPVVIAYSIPGAVLLGKVLPQFTLNEAVGAYMLVGLATFTLTATGAIKKVVDHIPVPIMLGMVGGVLLSFGVSMFSAAIKTPSIYGVMLVVFFITMTFRRFSQKIPPIMIAMIAGAILLTSFGLVKPVSLNLQLAKPVFVIPDISLKAILNISVPLFFLVIGVQNIQAVGVLMAEGYKPPINAMYLVPSIGAFINGLVGAHPAVTAGPSTAICSSSAAGERKDMRFIAAFFEGVFWFLFALSAKVAIDAVKLVPSEFTAVLAGLAMFDVFGSAFKGAFSGQFRSGAVVAFFVAITNLSILNIGAPFWAIIFGVLTSLLLEKNDFKFANGNNGK